jgi:plastocyanin
MRTPATKAAASMLLALALMPGCLRDQELETPAPGPTTVNLIAREYQFRPGGTQLQPGQKVELNIRNAGRELHNFTAEFLNEDRDIPPGESITIEFTASTKETHNRFYCKYHRDQDMGGNLNIPSIDTPAPGGGGPPGGRPGGPP